MNLLAFLSLNLDLGNRFERIWKIAQVDFKKRYYNDKLGLLWALLNPIFTVIIYYFVFTVIMDRVGSGINNYALFLFSGLIFWIAFVEMLKKGMKLLSQKRYLIENIKMNISDLYLSASLSIVFSFTFNILAYLAMCLLFNIDLSIKLLFMPILVVNIFLLGCGCGMFLSIVYVHFRDIMHLLDLILMLTFWTSGIFFKAELILTHVPIIYYINPFVGIIDNVRKITLYNDYPNIATMNLNILVGLIIFHLGFFTVTNFNQKAMEKL